MLQKKSKKVLTYFFLFLIIGTLNNKNFKNIDFIKINKISITGLDEKNNTKLLNDLNFLRTHNLFFLREIQLRDAINENNYVENFSVFKKYPSTLNIKIDQTKFLAKIINKDGEFFLGSNGKLIKKKNISKDLPFVFGDFKIESFLKLKNAIDKQKFDYKEIKNLFFFKSGRWDIETKNGLLIKLPRNQIEESLKLVKSFLLLNKEKKYRLIDLRQQNQIITNE